MSGAAPALRDVQGLVARGYAELPAARFLLLRFDDRAAAGSFLAGVAGALTASDARPGDQAVNVALTSGGLRRLGLDPAVLALFSHEFVDGMAEPLRSRTLGDVDANAPERWEWGGPQTTAVDAALLLYARDATALDALVRARAPQGAGVTVVRTLETADFGGYEPFGFRDGISQPILEGLSKAVAGAETIRFGEFVLGYPNEYGLVTDRPLVERSADPRSLLPADPGGSGRADLGLNGTYLVLRQLEQDVPGFWRFADAAARDGAGRVDPARRAWLAAKLVGRWPSGAPLVLAPEADDPSLASANDFRYFAPDPRGARCPIGAHIRRANPRDSLDPQPGSDASLAINHRHRLLRRGREYGAPITVDEALAGDGQAGAPRGLHFACLNANIARQFEFVQSTWLVNPKFAGLYDDADPLLAPAGPYGRTFTAPTDGVRRRFTGLPQLVTVRGGAYLFMPGIAAVRWLAALAS